MNWLFPTFLAGVAAIALPIILHFLRRQPKRTIVFPSLRFLAVAHQRTAKRQHLMRLLVLLLRCLALALLAAAFARPFFSAHDPRSGKSTVIVIDNSFSLQATGRWEKLRAWARSQGGRVHDGDKLGLLLTGPTPTWLAPLSTDITGTIQKLDRLEPGWYAARPEAALHLAADTLTATGGSEQTIIFLGDHQRASWAGTDFSQPLAPGVGIIFPPLPEPVTRQAALSPPTLNRTERGLRVSLVVRNFTSAHSRRFRVFRGSDLIPAYQETLALTDRETRTLNFELPAGTPGVARFRFTLDPDDLAADDTVYAVAQIEAGRALFLDAFPAGTNAADFLATALGSTASIQPALDVQPLPTATAWPAGAVVILRNDASFAGVAATRLDTFLRDGGSVLIFISGGPAQKKWLAETQRIAIRPLASKDKSLLVHDWAMDHPIVSALSEHEVSPLLGWSFRQGWALPTSSVESLALWSDDAAAIGETRSGAGHLLLCGFPPDRRDGDWPVHPAFVPFLHRAVAYLLGTQSGGPQLALKVGDALPLPADSGTWLALDGPAESLPARPVTNPVKATLPGVYEFTDGKNQTLFAVNLAAEESDPAPWTDGEPWLGLISNEPVASKKNQPQVTLAAFDAEQNSPLWWWLFAAVGFLLLAELGLANRTAR